MPAEMNLDEIAQFWQQLAEQLGTGYMASCKDLQLIQLENRVLSSHLYGDVVDLGCCNGISMLSYAALTDVRKVTGVDAEPKMLEIAKQLYSSNSRDMPSLADCDFIESDIRNIPLESKSYACAVFKRVLCNLYDWENQRQAIDEAMRLAREHVIMVEPFEEGEKRFNSLRSQFNLPDQLMPTMCSYLREERLTDYMQDNGWKLSCRQDPFSTYFLVTRLFRLLLEDVEPADEQLTTPLHAMAADLPSWGEWSNQKLLVFRRRGS